MNKCTNMIIATVPIIIIILSDQKTIYLKKRKMIFKWHYLLHNIHCQQIFKNVSEYTNVLKINKSKNLPYHFKVKNHLNVVR